MSALTREIPHPTPGVHTGGMVALLPDAATLGRLQVEGGSPAGEVHLTLAYLGDDVTTWPQGLADAVVTAVVELADDATDEELPLEARAFAHMTFNPDGGPDGDRDPCAAYGIGDTEDLEGYREDVLGYVAAILSRFGVDLPAQHAPFVPHVTAGYGLRAEHLSYVGPVRFDRLAVALGPRWIEIGGDTVPTAWPVG